MPKEINHQHDSYKIDSGVECGEDRLSGYRELVEKNMSYKLYHSCFQITTFLCILFFILFPCCDTL
jgi:hypothetical protein